VTRIAVIHYGATGDLQVVVRAVADGGAGEGAEGRPPHVGELPPELPTSVNRDRGRRCSEPDDRWDGAVEDLEQTGGSRSARPTRLVHVAAQLKVPPISPASSPNEDSPPTRWRRSSPYRRPSTPGQAPTILALSNILYHE